MHEHDYPVPGLEELLRGAADDAGRRVVPPSYELLRDVAHRRRITKIATVGGLAAVLAMAVGLASGIRFTAAPAPQPPAHTVVDDPALRQYRTTMPVLVWTPMPGLRADEVDAKQFYGTVFAALGPGDRDYTNLVDIRTWFPDAPVGGPGLAMDQSVTKAQLQRAAAALKKVDGVRDAGVIEVTGMWFIVSGTSGPITAKEATSHSLGNVDYTGFPKGVGGGAGGTKRLGDGKFLWTERITYFGPSLDRATFDLLRTRVAASVHIDPAKVVVTPQHG
jgi:hypothetical protein